MQSTPTGTLRITAPVLFGSTVLSGLIAEYMELHPQVNIDLVLSDQVIDLVQEGIDVAFRVGQLEDSSLIGRYLGDVKAILCASADYIDRFGKPSHPDEISNHQVIAATGWTQWSLKGPEEQEVNVNIKPRLKVNDLSSLYTLALSGAGITALPVLIAASAIKSKNLVPILCDWPFEAHPIQTLYASNRHLSAKVRSFVDFVIERVRPNPPWLVDMEGHDECEMDKELPKP
jgi:DNA-binding transcriptional LysR family regulator